MSPHGFPFCKIFCTYLCVMICCSSRFLALAQSKKWDIIRIATEGSYPPFNQVNAHGEIGGFEIDYAGALCQKIGAQCIFTTQDWDGIIPGLLTGKYDAIITAIEITERRKQIVAFSEPYARLPPTFIGRKEMPEGHVDPQSLEGKHVGVQAGTQYAEVMAKLYPDLEIKLYPTINQAVLDLECGRLDYILADKIPLIDYIRGEGKKCCKFIADLPPSPKIQAEGMAIVLRKEDPELLNLFNQAIRESFKDGTHRKLQNKYFDFDIFK